MIGQAVQETAGTGTEVCCPMPQAAPIEPDLAEDAARLFRALGDPARLGILHLLALRQAPVCVCEIVANFKLGQPTISYHLKLLREAGLVDCAKRGTWCYYSLKWQAVARAQKALALVL